ncbi:MAG: GspE/PulE family protein [Elusimicrobiaceae bacterium]|nr:GspE/PulE family protein [Elusimicrobiaceae bacterium]
MANTDINFKMDQNLFSLVNSVMAQSKGANPNELATRVSGLILSYCVKEGASDIHIEPLANDVTIRMRVDGMLRDLIKYPKTNLPITARIRVLSGFPPQAATAYSPEDGRFQAMVDGRAVQFRVSSFPTMHGEKLVVRVLDIGKGKVSLESLGFTVQTLKKLRSMIKTPSGMFIVAGLTGSGKTTTLCSILQELSSPELNIMTVEDPVEYEIERVTHSQINGKAGFSFAEALRCILRQDPNIIMLGEIRDKETAEIALRAATSGHMIFSTVHAATTIGVVHRFLSMDIEPYMVGSTLTGVLAQRLVRRVCSKCAEPTAPDANFFAELIKELGPAQTNAVSELIKSTGGRFLKAKGCPECAFTGYRGRIGIFELLPVTAKTRELIMTGGKTNFAEIHANALASGMKPMIIDAIEKLWMGVTTQEEIARTLSGKM